MSALASLLAVGQAAGALPVWTGPDTGGVFNDDDNWSLNSPGDNTPLPNGPNDHAIFGGTVDVNGLITFDADVTHLRTTIQNASGIIEFDAGDHRWTMTSYLLIAGTGVNGFPQVRHVGGEIQAAFVLLGNDEFSPNPSLEITGPNTHFHTTQGSGGYQIGVGPVSDGASIRVSNGARMSADGQTIVGLQGSRNTTLTIEGQGTVFEGGNYIAAGHTGYFGLPSSNNRIEVLDGASATASHLYMSISAGATSNNTVLVSGAGSRLTLTGVNNNDGGSSAVGWRDGQNTLRIENGAVVDGTTRFFVGWEPTSSDNQIQIDNGALYATELQINRGSVAVTEGVVDLIEYFNESPLSMAYEGGGITANLGTAAFTFNSGEVRSVNADFDNGLAFTVGNGSVPEARYHMRKQFAGGRGEHRFTDGVFLASNGVLSGDGDVVGNVSGSVGGRVEVGSSIGLVNVSGDWDNTGLGVLLELGDLLGPPVAGEGFDQLNVTGQFTHGGQVTIDLSSLTAPTEATTLRLIGWGSESGASSATQVTFQGGTPLEYAFQSDGLYVTAVAGGGVLIGDYNDDGVVDAADYTVWRDKLGTSAVLPNDPQGGPISAAQYQQWRDNYGATASASTSVPEPAALAMALAAAAGVATRRKRGL